MYHPLLFEFREKARHRLSRSPNDLTDFLMSQSEPRIGVIMERTIPIAPIEKKCRKFLARGSRMPHHAHSGDCRTIRFTQLQSHLDCKFTVVPHKMNQTP